MMRCARARLSTTSSAGFNALNGEQAPRQAVIPVQALHLQFDRRTRFGRAAAVPFDRLEGAMTMKSGFIPFCGYTVTPFDARPPERTAPTDPTLLDIWAARRRQR